MDAKSGIRISGHLQIIDTPTGVVLRDCHNLVVSAGLIFLTGYLSGGTMTAMTRVAVGSGSTGEAAADTGLAAQIEDRHTATITEPTPTSVKFSANWPAAAATGNWYEAGIFNAASGPTMLCRVTYGLLTKAAGDDFTIDYTVTLADDGV